MLSGHAFPSVTTSHAHTTRVWPNLVSERNDAGMLALIRGCTVGQRDPLPCFFRKNNLGNMLNRNQNGNDEEQCVLIMCCTWLFAWKDYFRSDEWRESHRQQYLAAWTLTSWSFCMCSFLRCLHLKAATLFRSLLILLFSSSSKESWEKKIGEKSCHFCQWPWMTFSTY